MQPSLGETLADLLRAAKGDHDWPWLVSRMPVVEDPETGEQWNSPGFKVITKHGNTYRHEGEAIVGSPMDGWPDDKTILGYAAGCTAALGETVTPLRVILACARTKGFSVDDAPPSLVVRLSSDKGLDDLTDESVELALSLIRNLPRKPKRPRGRARKD